MNINERNKIKVLFHLSDGSDHNDPARGLTREQHYVACQELKAEGCIHFISYTTGYCAKIKDKGRGVLDNFIQEQKFTDMMNINEMEEDEKKLILYLGDSVKYASYYADIEDDYNEIFDDLLFGGYVKYGETADDMDSLTRKGKKLFNLVESEMNKLTKLDWIILDELVKHEEPIFDIRCENKQLQLYSNEEITNSCFKLKSMGLVNFFYDENDEHKSHWFMIEDEGRIFVRDNKQQNNENIVLEETLEEYNEAHELLVTSNMVLREQVTMNMKRWRICFSKFVLFIEEHFIQKCQNAYEWLAVFLFADSHSLLVNKELKVFSTQMRAWFPEAQEQCPNDFRHFTLMINRTPEEWKCIKRSRNLTDAAINNITKRYNELEDNFDLASICF